MSTERRCRAYRSAGPAGGWQPGEFAEPGEEY
jgi:hypothetical protein